MLTIIVGIVVTLAVFMAIGVIREMYISHIVNKTMRDLVPYMLKKGGVYEYRS